MQLVIICSQITSGFHSSLARGAQINFLASNRFWGNNHKDPNHNNKNDENCTYNDYNDRLIKFIMILRNNPGKGQTGSGIYTSDGVIFIFFLKYKYTNTQIHKFANTNTQIHKYINPQTQIHKYITQATEYLLFPHASYMYL